MPNPRCPTLYQVNTRVWMTALARTLGRPATLDDITDAALDGLTALGFDWVWLLGVWQTGVAGQAVSRNHQDWQRAFAEALPDLTDADIGSSPFAVSDYRVHRDLGGDAALARLRERLAARGLRLMLDFVPNHLAPDHPWVREHPDWFVTGHPHDLAWAPQNWFRPDEAPDGPIFAHGRDPNFPGWPDTIQLNYGEPAVQSAMRAELLRIADQCDGLRCDMAMLLLPEVFGRTWGITAAPFWPAAIAAVRAARPDFLLLAEVYWDLEWALHEQGFDFCYDKRLYDRLRDGDAGPVRAHLGADPAWQQRLARFLENHDEARAAALFPPERHRAAALLTYLTPGLKLFHQGQFEGRRRHLSPHLVRAADEPPDPAIAAFYRTLLGLLRHRALGEGRWQLLDCTPAWDGNPSHGACIAWVWYPGADDPAEADEHLPDEHLLVVVNQAGHDSQARLPLPFVAATDGHWLLADLLDETVQDCPAATLGDPGLWLELPPWGARVLALSPTESPPG